MDFLNEKSVITKLRVGGERLDAVSTRLYFERMFANTNIAPAGLPPKSIVCIRQLTDPAPRTLRLNRNALRFSDSWQNAVEREIGKFFRRAVRPINETVPAQAESVIFTDKAELLACLANDWCKGNMYRNWWWRSLFPNLDRAQTVARLWLESAEYIPAALNILAKKKTVVEFVRKLPPVDTAALLKRVIEIFGLKKIRHALFEPLTLKEKRDYQKITGGKTQSPAKKTSAEFFDFSETIFEEIKGTEFQNLNFEQKILLVTGLTLARLPHVARSEKTARQIRELRIVTESVSARKFIKSETVAPQIAKPKIIGKESAEKITPGKEKEIQTGFIQPKAETEISPEQKPKIVFHESEIFEERTIKPPETKSGIENETHETKSKKKIEEIRLAKSKREIVFEDEKPQTKPKTYRAEDEKFLSINSTDATEESETEEFEKIVRTDYGGVFYLLNLGLYLKLYRDFSEPLGEEIDLSIWDFAALLSRKLLGKKIEKDEVWKLLKYLAGREGAEKFGEDFNPPDEWRIPSDWLKTFRTDGKWVWSKTKNRLIVRHSENFSVLDIPVKRNFKNQLEKELRCYRQYFSAIAESKTVKLLKILTPRERYLENLFGFAERRLRQALNVEKRDELNKILFAQSATVAVSATHLDITFSLADLPLAVRFSGLDRNPGWIPAAGKYVEFHFV